MTRLVTVTLTEPQWLAIESAANCAADTYDDALAVLGSPSRVRALNRGLDRLADELHRAGAYNRYLAQFARAREKAAS